MFLEVVNFSKIYEKIQEAKQLQKIIFETETRITQASTQLTSLGLKSSNIKKLAQDIDASGKQLSQVSFKNTNGTLSLVPNQISQSFDQQMRTIFQPLVGRSITVASVDKPRRNEIALLSKEVAKYGMKSSDFNNLLKKVSQITKTHEYVVYTLDGYLVTFGAEEVPEGGGGGSNVPVPIIGFIIEGQEGMDFFEVGDGGVWGSNDGIRSTSYIAIGIPLSNSESPFVRMSFSVTDTPEGWAPAEGLVGSRFSADKNVGVEYMYYNGDGLDLSSSPAGIMDLIPNEELSDIGISGSWAGQTLHVGAIRSSDGIIPGLYNIKVEYINRNQAELGQYVPYYEKNFYFSLFFNTEEGGSYGEYDQYSQYDNQVSLEWFEEVSVPPFLNYPKPILIENIRSGSNVPVGVSSSFETTAINLEGGSTYDELLNLQFILRGTGQIRVTVNGNLHFRYPEDIGTTKSLEFEYSAGEPGYWNWVSGSMLDECVERIVDQEFIDMVSSQTSYSYDQNTWMMRVGDQLIKGFGIGLMRGTNTIQVEFIPSSQGSFARIILLSYEPGLPDRVV